MLPITNQTQKFPSIPFDITVGTGKFNGLLGVVSAKHVLIQDGDDIKVVVPENPPSRWVRFQAWLCGKGLFKESCRQEFMTMQGFTSRSKLLDSQASAFSGKWMGIMRGHYGDRVMDHVLSEGGSRLGGNFDVVKVQKLVRLADATVGKWGLREVVISEGAVGALDKPKRTEQEEIALRRTEKIQREIDSYNTRRLDGYEKWVSTSPVTLRNLTKFHGAIKDIVTYELQNAGVIYGDDWGLAPGRTDAPAWIAILPPAWNRFYAAIKEDPNHEVTLEEMYTIVRESLDRDYLIERHGFDPKGIELERDRIKSNQNSGLEWI